MNSRKFNYGQSVKVRLLNLAREENIRYQQLITRYFQERLLFRLSQSKFRSHFVLKGGALLYAYDKFAARPTLDIDFMGHRINNDKENIKLAFREICEIVYEKDGVQLNRETIYHDGHILFSEAFARNEELNQRWNSFLKKINYEQKVTFEEVMHVLTGWLRPYWENLKTIIY